MSEFIIEKNIPIPKIVKYPFNQMQVGDSVFIKNGKPQGKEAIAARVLANYRRGQGFACKFHIARVEGGIRIWRVE